MQTIIIAHLFSVLFVSEHKGITTDLRALVIVNVSGSCVRSVYPGIVLETTSCCEVIMKNEKVSDEQVFYLMSRGHSEEEALAMIVNGFFEPFTRELPMEYAVELNRLLELEMEGSIG